MRNDDNGWVMFLMMLLLLLLLLMMMMMMIMMMTMKMKIKKWHGSSELAHACSCMCMDTGLGIQTNEQCEQRCSRYLKTQDDEHLGLHRNMCHLETSGIHLGSCKHISHI